MPTKFTRFGKDVDPANWDPAFKQKISDAGDKNLFSWAIVKKCWAQGLKEICEAGSAMELSIDDKQFTWTITPRTPKAKELLPKTKPELLKRVGRSSGKDIAEAPTSTSEKVEKTLKYLDYAGAAKDFVLFIVAVPAIGLNPLALMAEGWKTLDLAVGIGIGLAKDREEWGVEISKSALARLADYASEKLQAKRVATLKAAASDSVKARALYVSWLETELEKVRTQHAEFRKHEAELTEKMQQLSIAAHKWHGLLESEVKELVKIFKAGVTADQYNKMVTGTAKIVASNKELIKFHQLYVMDTAKDLWSRGAPSINQAAVTINSLQKEIADAKTTDFFAQRIATGKKTSEDAPSTEETLTPSAAKDYADLMLALTGDIDIWDVAGNIQLLLNTVAGLYNLKELVKDFRTNASKWKTERKSVWQSLESGWNMWTISKMPTTPKEKAKWKLAATPELERMTKEATELKRKQSAMEGVALAHNENIQKSYQEAVTGMENARKAYEKQVQLTKKTLDRAQETLKNPRFVDKQRRKELQSITGTIQNKRNQLKGRLDEKTAELAKIKDMALEENKFCMDILNEGHEQDINKRALEIQKLQQQIATVG